MRKLVLAAICLCWSAVVPPAPDVTPRGASGAPPAAALPLHFEPNRGQSSGAVRYLARAAGYDTYLTNTGARVALRTPPSTGAARSVRVMDLQFTGASTAPRITSEEPLPGRIHYLRGTDPSGWQTNVETFGKVRYAQMYPGIDLVFYGNERQLEYDFIVQPGAEPRQVRIEFAGADRMQIDHTGDLVLGIGDRHIVQRKPIVYQVSDGRREPVDAAYAALGPTSVGFEIGEYDRSRPLVIDPVLVYSTYFGGTGFDEIAAVATDPTGHVYVAGSTASNDFPATAGAYDTTVNGSGDAFVAKLNPSGTALVYSTVFGGMDIERAHDVAVDAAGHAYVTGHTTSPDFPVSPGAFATPCPGGACGFDAFVVKLNAAGSGVVYGARLSGTSNDSAYGIALDDDGTAVVVGNTRSIDYPLAGAAYQSSKRGGAFSDDHFVTKLNATGSALVYSTYFGGSGDEEGVVRVAIDPAGNAYVGGETESADFPTLNALQPAHRGTTDGFVASFGPFGNLLYSTYLGGSSFDVLEDVAVDADGAAYATGYTNSTDFPLVVPADSTFAVREAFVTKILPGGGSLAYSSFLGGAAEDRGQGIAVDADGHAHVAVFAGADFPTTSDGARATGGGAFYARLDSAGSEVTFASFIGPAFPRGIAADGAGNVYIAGQTIGAGITTRNSLQGSPGGVSGNTDGFLAKFGEWPAPASADDIVLYATNATTIAGAWRRVTDPNAGGYAVLHHPDAGAPRLSGALSAPEHYFELTFTPQVNRPYRLWLRGKAERDRYSNDSVFVQFSGSVNASGAATYRTGTTAATMVNLEECANCELSGWGWQDNGYGAGVRGGDIYFASNAPQTLRVQTREDGMMIDQIVLSPGTWTTTAPGALKQDTTVLRDADGADGGQEPTGSDHAEIVLHAMHAALTGNWRFEADTSAAGGYRAWNPDAGLAKRKAPLAQPSDHAELTFEAQKGRAYRLWIRGRAENNFWGNDSVHVQFSGSVDAQGTEVFRIGTTSAAQYNLESCSGCGLSGWGWEDNGWGVGVLGPVIYFAADGPQTIRLQTREDGLSIDQIVLSSALYLHSAPGAAKNDTVILPATSAPEIILHAADATALVGNWHLEADSDAASGQRAWNPDAGAPKRSAALEDPADYIELSFAAQRGRAYRLWIRGRADHNY